MENESKVKGGGIMPLVIYVIVTMVLLVAIKAFIG
jgi:hypothetical protein